MYIFITKLTIGHTFNHFEIQDLFKYFKYIHILYSKLLKKKISKILLISFIISNF